VRLVARAVERAVSRTVVVASTTVAVVTAALVGSGGSGGGGGGGGGSSGIGEGKGSGGDEANSGDSNGGGPYNNQLKDPAEETMAAATVTAMDTATATVKAMEKDKNNANNDDGESRIATKTASPECTLRQKPLRCLGIQCRWR
jgi:hypothetical protein